jgi:hypothetical protein
MRISLVPFVVEFFHPQKRRAPNQQLRFVNRFGNKIVCASLYGGQFVGLLVERSHDDYRDETSFFFVFQNLAYAQAVYSGHHDIEQHKVYIRI